MATPLTKKNGSEILPMFLLCFSPNCVLLPCGYFAFKYDE